VERQVHPAVEEAEVQRRRLLGGARQQEEVVARGRAARGVREQYELVSGRHRQAGGEGAPGARTFRRQRAEVDVPQAAAERRQLPLEEPRPDGLERLLRPEQ
jgi:hypothetical protein